MITKQELKKLDELQKKLKIMQLKEGLTNFNEKTNPNYKFLYNAIKDQEYERFIDIDGSDTAFFINETVEQHGLRKRNTLNFSDFFLSQALGT